MIKNNDTETVVKQQEKYGLKYVKNKRFIVEIKDEETGRIFYSKRFYFKHTAFQSREHYNKIAGYFARCFDTKTGDVN